MMQCQQCQPLILDYLYGLLEASEMVVVESHIRECAACAAVRDEATRVQGLIARAAKGAFPQVRFDPPIAKPTPTPATQATNISWPLPLPSSTAAESAPKTDKPTRASHNNSLTRTTRGIPWLAWAIAASVLLAIPGTVIPVLGILNRADSARKATDDSVAIATAATTQTEKAVLAAHQHQADVAYNLTIAKQAQEGLLAKWVDEVKAAVQAQTARKMTVDVLKPATVQPGAPNEFLLVLHDRGLAPNTKLVAEVRDQTDAVIFSQQLNHEKKKENRHILRLPAETWTKLSPQSELFLVVSSEDGKTKARTELLEKVRLFGPVFATMLVTDRPTYRPGEMLYFRSLTLDRMTFQPPNREQSLQYELRGPHQHPVFHPILNLSGGTDLVRVREAKVDPVLGPDGKPIRGVGCGAFFLPRDLQDGDYTLLLRELPHPGGYPAAIPFPITRSIKVRSGTVDAFAKMIGYTAASYSAGDVVEAWAELKLQGQPVSGAEVAVVAVVDNEPVKVLSAPATGPDGRTSIRFILPDRINRADSRLKVTFKTKMGDESIAERVPVIGHNLIVEFFPESGPLIAGVPCRVYVRATTPTGQPVDIRGTITDGRKALAHVETLTDNAQPGANRGLGSFTYTPVLGTPVWLKLESPSGAFAPLLDGPLPIAPAIVAGIPAVVATRSGFLLPKPEADGVAMSVVNPVSAPHEPIRVHLQSAGQPRNLIVGAYTRGRLSDTRRISTQPGQLAMVELMANPDPRGGVVRITVFEEPAEHADALGDMKPDIKPIAERLVFRKPGESLQLAFRTTGNGNGANGTAIAANSSIDMTLTATDEKGKPTAAILWAAAVNAGVAPGKRDRLVTTHFLLAGEVSTPDAMEYADFLLTDHPKAAESLDLVLATQGWRHFVEQTPPALTATHRVMAYGDQAKLLICNGQYLTQAEQPEVREQHKLDEAYLPRYEAASKTLTAAQAASDAATADAGTENRIRELAEVAQHAQGEMNAAAERAKAAAQPVERLRGAGWYGIAGFGLLAVMLGSLALARPFSRLPFGIGTVGSVGLVAFLVVALGMAERTQAAIRTSEETAKISQWPAIHAPAGSTVTENNSDRTAHKPPIEQPLASIQAMEAHASVAGKGTLGPPGGFGGGSSGVAHSKMAAGGPKGAGEPASQPTPAAPGGIPGPVGNGAITGPPAMRLNGGMGGGARLGAGFPAPDGKGPASPMGFAPILTKDGNSNERKVIPDWELPQTLDAFPRSFAYGRKLADGAESEVLKRATDKAKTFVDDRANLLRAPLDLLRERGIQAASQNKPAGAQTPVKLAETGQTPEMMAYDMVVKAAVPTIPPLVVREYAAPRPGTEGADSDISDTILWQPVIVLPSDGKATLTFQLGAAKGGYQVVIAGHTLDGRIGAVRKLIAVAPQSVPSTTPALPTPIPPTMP